MKESSYPAFEFVSAMLDIAKGLGVFQKLRRDTQYQSVEEQTKGRIRTQPYHSCEQTGV